MSRLDKEAFVKKVGINSRRIAPKHICTSDLCIEAVNHLFSKTGTKPEDIGVVVFVTQTPDFTIPGNSMLIQERLRFPKSVLLLDLHQGCAGYVYGLSVLAGLLNTVGSDRGLLLVGDTITKLLSPEDKSTVPIFSDAASATLVERSSQGNPMQFKLGADGGGAEVISVVEGGARNPFTTESLKLKEVAPGIRRAPTHLKMLGLDVLHYSFRYVAPNIRQLLEQANQPIDEIDYFVFHQANQLLNQSLQKKLKIDPQKAPETLSVFGNTSSASIPLTICHRLGDVLVNSRKKILLSGFGMGFSWGSVLLDIGSLDCVDVLEMK
jgi:3-oxoacyl-[acyl-carrier-protein] synthase-3